MLNLQDAERSLVLSLLRYSHEDRKEALSRYAKLPPRFSSECLANQQWRDLFEVIASNAAANAATTPTLAAQQTTFDEWELRELMQGVDPDAISAYQKDVMYYAHKRLVTETAKEAAQTADELDPDQAISSIMAQFAQIDLANDDDRIASTSDRCNIGLESLLERRETLQAGEHTLTMPLKELDEMVPYIMPGSMVLLTAQTGCGKSTFAAQTYDYHIKHGGNALLFHFEDTVELVWLRRVARQMKAFDIAERSDDFSLLPKLLLSKHNPPTKEQSEKLNAIVERYGKRQLMAGGGVPFHRLVRGDLTDIELGKIELINAVIQSWGDGGTEVYCGGWTMDQVIRTWLRYDLQAQADGERIDFVVVDYLNKARLLPWVRQQYGVYSGRGRDAERLKLIAERTGAVILLVQQEKETGTPYETNASRQKSQLWLSLRREEDQSTGGWSEQGSIRVRKANAGQTGGIPALFNARNMIWEQA